LVQLRELENSIDVAIGALGRTSWTAPKQVSGPSTYVPDLEYALENLTDIVKPLVEQKKYLRNFFDKASRY
jgi:vacuolar protein sorting-associated protein 53